jgi:O-antigen polysaccharide polymerase Wzy
MNSNHQDVATIHRQILQEKYLRNLAGGLIFLLVLYSIYLIDQRPVVVSFEKALLAVGIIWVSMYPSLQYLFDQNRPPMPFMPLIGIFYATSFGLPMFAGEVKITGFFSLKEVDSTSLTLVLTSLIGMNLAFYFSKSSVWANVKSLSLPRNYPLKKLFNLIWVFLFFHLAYEYIPFLREIPSTGQLLGPAGYIAYGMFFILWKRGRLSKKQKLILMGVCLPMEIFPRLGSGSLAGILTLGLFITVISFVETKKLPIVLISISLAIYLFFAPVKGEFRKLTWQGGTSLNSIEKVQLFIDLAYKRYTTPKIVSGQNLSNSDADQLASRSAHILLFSAVVKSTPSKVPYWNGESYLPLLTNFIPRILFPDKPSEQTGNYFGKRYGYLGSRDNTTSFNLPWIVEFYANFGETGVILGMSSVGVLLAFLEQKFNSSTHPLELVTGTSILLSLVYQESNFSLMFGGVILLTISLYVIYKMFLGVRRIPNQ